MKLLIVFVIVWMGWMGCFAQPNGFEYVVQPGFESSIDTSYPHGSGDWFWNGSWECIQSLGNQTDWYGPNYMPLGASSHKKYVVLDDDGSDYGALSGDIHPLEYRLVRCSFDYRIFDPLDSLGFVDGGTLYVLLSDDDNDLRAFDANNPQQFEADGHGQLLFAFALNGGTQLPLSGAWDSLSNPTAGFSRTAYVLNRSAVGDQGSPFRKVGLLWRSDDPFESRICIDNFRLRDVCPDCVLREPLTNRGCMDTLWTTPITNNYHAHTVTIRDSTSNTLVFQTVNQRGRFGWDGVGNQGPFSGQPLPYGQPLRAHVKYYGCMKAVDNIRDEDYVLMRLSGCNDPGFGGYRVSIHGDSSSVWPNPVAKGGVVKIRISERENEVVWATLNDVQGRSLLQFACLLSQNGQMEVQVPHEAPAILFLNIQGVNFELNTKIVTY
jgi:hypothetical protein